MASRGRRSEPRAPAVAQTPAFIYIVGSQIRRENSNSTCNRIKAGSTTEHDDNKRNNYFWTKFSNHIYPLQPGHRNRNPPPYDLDTWVFYAAVPNGKVGELLLQKRLQMPDCDAYLIGEVWEDNPPDYASHDVLSRDRCLAYVRQAAAATWFLATDQEEALQQVRGDGDHAPRLVCEVTERHRDWKEREDERRRSVSYASANVNCVPDF